MHFDFTYVGSYSEMAKFNLRLQIQCININIKMLGMSSHNVTIPPSSFAMPPPLAHSLDRLADTEAHANTTEGAPLVNEAGIGTIQGNQGVAGAKCEPFVA